MDERWHLSNEAVVTMLKSWPGLIALAAHPYGLHSLINALALPNNEARRHVSQEEKKRKKRKSKLKTQNKKKRKGKENKKKRKGKEDLKKKETL